MPQPIAFAWALLLIVGCGTSADDEIPSELLAAIAQGHSSSSDYPAGPYSGQLGGIAPNICLNGWGNPRANEFDANELEEICFSDFWDPDAMDHQLLLVNTGAIWCAACQVEYAGTGSRPSLAEEAEQRAPDGLRVLGTLFQDAQRQPASEDDAVRWAKRFDVNFPFGVDAPFAMGAFADPLVQPFNMLVDTKTMEVVLRLQGDEPTTLWPAIDAFLAASK